MAEQQNRHAYDAQHVSCKGLTVGGTVGSDCAQVGAPLGYSSSCSNVQRTTVPAQLWSFALANDACALCAQTQTYATTAAPQSFQTHGS